MPDIPKLDAPFSNKIVGHGSERIDQLLANPLNYRIHPIVQQETLAGAIDSIGYIKSILVNKRNGRVIDGHLRVALLSRSGVEEIPVEYVDLTESEEALALLSLDPIASMAVNDKDKMEKLMKAFSEESEKLKETLGEIAAENDIVLSSRMDGGIPSEYVDKSDSLVKKFGVEMYQIWHLGNHRLYVGDSADTTLLNEAMGADTFQILATSFVVGNSAPIPRDFELALWNIRFDESAIAMVDIPKKGYDKYLQAFANKGGWLPREFFAYIETSNGNQRYCSWGFDLFNIAFVFYKGRPYFPNHRNDYNIFNVTAKLDRKWVAGHAYFMDKIGNSQYLVIDPWAGIGTYLLACEKVQKRCIAMEKDVNNCAVILKRWADMTNQTPTLEKS